MSRASRGSFFYHITNGLCCEQIPTKLDSNQPVQLQKLARWFEILGLESGEIILFRQ